MKSNILLQGEIGSGKTYALQTLLPEYWSEPSGSLFKGAGLHALCLSFDPGIDATIGRNLCGHPEAPSVALHHHYIPPVAVSWQTMRHWALLANTIDIEKLTQMSDPKRGEYGQFLDLFDACNRFVCDGCNKDFGSISELGEDWAAALDGLTGLTTVARRNMCGGSPFLSLPKIGGIQGLVEGFLDQWWGNTACNAILIAHIERETSPMTGMQYLALSTIGQKLAPKILKKPDEIILARRERGRYYWDTSDDDYALKQRRLPARPDLPPDFSQIFSPRSNI
jgi:hypothetical protein